VNFALGRARLPAERDGKRLPKGSQLPTRCGQSPKENNRQGVDHMKRIVLGLLAATAMSFSALCRGHQAGPLFDLGGKFDKSFNEASFNGAEKFKAETGIEYREFEIANDAQREQALRRFAEDGNNPIVMAGFSWAAALEKVATEFPDTKFAIIDMVVDKPNVRSVVFKEQEGSYLVGMLAGMASKSKKVGFVGGMDIPLIRKFGCGYVGGAKSAGATEVIQNMTGDTPAPGTTRPRAAKSPSRRSTRAPTCLRGGRRHRRRRAAGGGRRRQARHRRRFQPERPAARARC
jgi:predicted ester cyclase